MSRASFHDVIVVGTDRAALLAAGLLARQKYRVLLLGHGGLRTLADHDGQRVPALPCMLPPLGRAPLLDDLLRSLAVEDPVHPLGEGELVPLQVVTPAERLDLPLEPVALARELGRGAADQQEAFLRRVQQARDRQATLEALLEARPALPPGGLGDRLRLSRWKRALVPPAEATAEEPPLWRILTRATAFLGNLPAETSAPLAVERLVLDLLDGLRFVPDLSQRLLEALGRIGVELRPEAVVEEIGVEGGRLAWVRSAPGSELCRCRALVGGLPLGELLELVPLKQRRRGARLLADSTRPFESAFTVNLVVPAGALPVGLARHVLLVQDPGAPLEEDNLIRLQVLPFPGRKERVQICLACMTSYRRRGLGREHLGPLQKRMFQAAAGLLPFLEEHLEGLTSPFWGARQEDAGHPSPWLIQRTLETDQPVWLGLGVLPSRPAYANLWLAGPEVLPGLGLRGEAWAALQAAAGIQRRHPLQKAL
jgi:phytoene dehydrogenase-like protein